MKINIDSDFKGPKNNEYQIYAPYQLQIGQLNQIKDAVSNSNVNSSYNSRTSSPHSANISSDLASNSGNNVKSARYRDIDTRRQFDYDINYYAAPTSGQNYATGDSGYTNPDLLKQLNIGPFPKRDNSPSPVKQGNLGLQQQRTTAYESPSKNYDNDYSNYNFN